MNFPLKVFWRQFNPKRGYKMLNKSSKKSVDSGGFREREQSCIAFGTRSKNADTLLIKPCISNTRLLTAYHTTTPQINKPAT